MSCCGRYSPPPSEPTEQPSGSTSDNKQKIILFSVGGISLIILVIILSRSKKQK
jgi:hypothetical protein